MIIDLVIPALNEQPNIDALFDELDRAAAALPADVRLRHRVLADNGSTDDTAVLARARGAIVVCEPARGYGAACLRALGWIAEQSPSPDVIAFLDADLADDPTALPELIAPLTRDGTVLVIGSRIRRAEPGALNTVQRFGNRFACTLIRGLAGQRYSDLGPFRAIRREALERLRMADRTWGWTVEMQMKAAMLGLPVAEVDVPYRRRRFGRSKISGTVRGVAAAGTRILTTIVRLRFHGRSALE